MFTLPCEMQRAGGKLLSSAGSSSGLCDDLEPWGSAGRLKRDGTCMPRADSLHRTAETNVTLYSYSTPMKT